MLITVELILLFFLGISLGSFLNVLIDRLPYGETVFYGRSHCDHCKHKLAWYDLIPFLSFVILKGRCRYCHRSLSVQYPMVELVTGVLFVIVGIMNHESGIRGIITISYDLFIVSSLIVIFLTDFKYGIIPDKIVFPSIIVSLVYLFINHKSLFINHFASAVVACLFFFLLFAITKGRGMGFGDVKLSFLLGLFLGFPAIVIAFYASFLTGAVISIILVLAKKVRFKGTIPFGPFLVAGTLLAYFRADSIIKMLRFYLQ